MDVEIIEILTFHGVNLNFRNSFGKSVLEIAIQQNCRPEILETLLKQNSNSNLNFETRADVIALDDNGNNLF